MKALVFGVEPDGWQAPDDAPPLGRSLASSPVALLEVPDARPLRRAAEGAARRGFELLDASGMLLDLLPEVAAMKGVAQPPEYHPEGDVWQHTLLLLEQLCQPTPTLALAALLHDVGKPATFRVADRIRFDGHVEEGVRLARLILTRLRFSREEIEQVEALIDNHMRFKDVGRMKESTLKRFLRLPAFDEHHAYLLAHPPARDHVPGKAGHHLEIVLRAGGHALRPKGQFFCRTAS